MEPLRRQRGAHPCRHAERQTAGIAKRKNPYSIVLETAKSDNLKRQVFHERNNIRTSSGEAQTCFLFVLPLSRYVAQDIRDPVQ